jgi:hypothetical protein
MTDLADVLPFTIVLRSLHRKNSIDDSSSAIAACGCHRF